MDYFTKNFKSIGKILLVMYGITALLLFLMAFFVQQFYWDKGLICIGVSAVYVISCLSGGFLAGKVQRSKKFIWGILIAMMYVLIQLFLTLAVKNGFTEDAGGFLVNLMLCLGSGMIGGMLA